jgi:hypothetical protein
MKSFLRRLLPARLRRLRGQLAYLHLLQTNPFIAPPGEVRRLCLLEAQRTLGYRNLVETGTYLGHTAAAAAGVFDAVHTIELDAALAAAAKRRFAGAPKVTVHHGDSAAILPDLLPRLEGGTVFWLDAHYSGGVTARGSEDTPLTRELECIREGARPPLAVFIDDARMLGTDPAYPSLPAVIDLLRTIDSDLQIGVIADLLWATPQPFLKFAWATAADGTVEISREDVGWKSPSPDDRSATSD